MSTGSRILTALDILESSAELSPVGTTRIRRKGGVLEQSTDGAAFASLGGGLAMSDVISTAGVAGQDLSVTALDGDNDGDYTFDAYIIYNGGVGLASFFLRPFGNNDTNLFSFIRYNQGSGVNVESGPLPNWAMFSQNTGSNSVLTYHGHITTKTGRNRMATYSAHQHLVGGGVKNAIVNAWSTDTSTNMTTLTVHSDVATGIAPGSFIRLRKLKSTL
jgi:hypothetical protein